MDVRYAPVRDYAGTVADQGAWINGYFQEAIDETGETIPIVGTPIKMSATPLTPSALVPELGQHTDALLRAQGHSDEQIADWRSRNVI
jgi:crotonobetainyl-CoA:carnitine CoA-transferase CaiB-like acyl-CoA transferase